MITSHVLSATFLLLLNAPVVALAQAAQRATLEQLRDKTRLLLIFVPAPDDARLKSQIKIIEANAAGARERDLAVVGVPGLPYALRAVETFALTEEHAAYTRFHVSPGSFVVILLGKDGGEKLRSTAPIPWQTLRSTIDAMPMRQEEMRLRKP